MNLMKEKCILPEITIHGEIKKNITFPMFQKEILKKIEINKPFEYKLNINSPGGSKHEASLIILKMANMGLFPKNIHGVNMVGSAAVYIYANSLYRTSNFDTKFHIHRSRDEITGVIAPEITPDEIKCFNILSHWTKIRYEEIIEIANNRNGEGTILSARDAKIIGLVHEII